MNESKHGQMKSMHKELLTISAYEVEPTSLPHVDVLLDLYMFQGICPEHWTLFVDKRSDLPVSFFNVVWLTIVRCCGIKLSFMIVK